MDGKYTDGKTPGYQEAEKVRISTGRRNILEGLFSGDNLVKAVIWAEILPRRISRGSRWPLSRKT